MDINSTFKLNNGIEIPVLGFGTFKIDPAKTRDMVLSALDAGYRHIDTAAFYQNETGVGQAIAESNVSREEVFIATKIWMDDLGRDKAMKAFDQSMSKLGLDYLDLYLIHWPRPLAIESWEILEKLYQEGRIRAIGVSNYTSALLEDLIGKCSVVPAVNQIELHPGLQQDETINYCIEKNIIVEAWSPLMKGEVMKMPVLCRIGEKYNKSPAQITLRWHLQRGIVIIPKSVQSKRIKSNPQIFDFELTGEEMEQISRLDSGTRTGPTPEDIYRNGFNP